MYSQIERVVVFHHPVNGVAGQSVLAGKRGHPAVFHPAEAALGCRPKRSVSIESKLVDPAFAQPIGAGEVLADLAVLEKCQAAVRKSKPKTAAQDRTVWQQPSPDVPAGPKGSVRPTFPPANEKYLDARR